MVPIVSSLLHRRRTLSSMQCALMVILIVIVNVFSRFKDANP
jgi:hypothetical protein